MRVRFGFRRVLILCYLSGFVSALDRVVVLEQLFDEDPGNRQTVMSYQ
jgi:hypothetical protein